MTRFRPSLELILVSLAALALGSLLTWAALGPKAREALFAEQMRSLQLVADLRLALSDSAEAEKSAVLADTDDASAGFAEQSRAGTRAAEDSRRKLAEILGRGGPKAQQDLLGQFSKHFEELRRVDETILDLAVRNSNLKALALTSGPAAQTLVETGDALSALAQDNLASPLAVDVLLQILEAQESLCAVQTMLPLHVAEAEEPRMDAMETAMARQRERAAQALESLADLDPLLGRHHLDQARAAFARYGEFTERIIALSRENTNVRSLFLSLTRKRAILALCQDDLAALEQSLRSRIYPATR